MNELTRFTRLVLTDSTNEVYDLAPVLAALGFVAGVIFEAWNVFAAAQPFNIQNFGIGVAALGAGYGAAVRLRGPETPPGPPPGPTEEK